MMNKHQEYLLSRYVFLQGFIMARRARDPYRDTLLVLEEAEHAFNVYVVKEKGVASK